MGIISEKKLIWAAETNIHMTQWLKIKYIYFFQDDSTSDLLILESGLGTICPSTFVSGHFHSYIVVIRSWELPGVSLLLYLRGIFVAAHDVWFLKTSHTILNLMKDEEVW